MKKDKDKTNERHWCNENCGCGNKDAVQERERMREVVNAEAVVAYARNEDKRHEAFKEVLELLNQPPN